MRIVRIERKTVKEIMTRAPWAVAMDSGTLIREFEHRYDAEGWLRYHEDFTK